MGGFTKDNKYPFVECASWADDIKYIDWDSMDKWHFDNIYIDGQKIISKTKYPELNLKSEKQDIVWAINEMKKTLRNTKISAVDDRLGKSINLRMLIHLIGDIHQPLHASTLVNDKFPRGDSGGNAFKINMPGAKNLHAYWDSCLKKYPSMKHPLSDRQFKKLDSFVDDIVFKHLRSSANISKRLEITSVKDWAYESTKLSLKYAYKGIKPGDKPSMEYIKKGQELIDEQLAVAGYRLADVLISVFSRPEVFDLHVKGHKMGTFKSDGLLRSNSNESSITDEESSIDKDSEITQKVSELFTSRDFLGNNEMRAWIGYLFILCLLYTSPSPRD